MKAQGSGTGQTVTERRDLVLLPLTATSEPDNPATAEITLPAGRWWRVMSLSAVVDLTGVVGATAFSVNCSFGAQTYWTVPIEGALSFPALVGSVCLAVDMHSVNNAAAPVATNALPYVLIPGGSLLSIAAVGGVGNITMSNIVAIIEAYD